MGRPVTVTVGPLATADADGVSLSQAAAGAQYLVVNGALAAGTFDADSICASQTPSGAGALTINGALATTNPVAGAGGTASSQAATVRFSVPQRIYITSAGNDAGATFTVIGTVQGVNSFGPGIVVSEAITGADTDVVASTNLYSSIISISIDGAAAAAVTVGNGGAATMDVARRIIITSAGDDSSITFTIAGTDWAGNPISEVVTGANTSVASSVLDYLTVTSILTSAATTSTVTIGTNGVAGSPWIRFDDYAANSQVAIQCTVSGSANGTVQQTMEDPNLVTNQTPPATYQWSRSGISWVNHPDSSLVAFSTTVQGNYGYAPVFARVVLNSGTGSITGTFRQAYLA